MPQSDDRKDEEKYCPHCENWHSGLCGDVPKDEPLAGIDIPLEGSR